MNPVLDAFAGGWELNSINTANTGTPINVFYSPASINDVTALSNDYRGEAFLRPNVAGSATSQSTSAMLNNYFAGYTFTTPLATAPFGDLGRNAFRAPGLEQWDLGVDKRFRIRESIGLQFRASSSISSTIRTSECPPRPAPARRSEPSDPHTRAGRSSLD